MRSGVDPGREDTGAREQREHSSSQVPSYVCFGDFESVGVFEALRYVFAES